MKNRSFVFVLLSLSCSVGFVACDRNATTASNPPNTPTTYPAAVKPDNTAMNKGDRDTAGNTPIGQGQGSNDVKITADIRRAVLDDKGLSTDAHNAKIITTNGAVILRGVVDNANEKDTLETKAKSVGGVNSVDNQLMVKDQ